MQQGDSTVVRFREGGPPQGNQPPAGARVREGGDQQENQPQDNQQQAAPAQESPNQ